ncbi:MAG: isopenicillin N synthase family oxygenase [Proteobacteria bacterium]|nr:isopenicillin N synthase family oxygenase [Pseudomonadota bacterium]
MIPVLDVSDYLAGDTAALHRLGAELRYAFENVGFWYLRGHGVPRSLIDAAFAECKRFHAQPLEDKLALRINEHNIGYMPMGGSIAKSSKVNNNTKPSVNEAFFLRRERTPDDPDVIANKRFRGLNQWPPNLPGFRDTALAYMYALEQLGRRLVRIYATALDLPAGYFDAMFEKPNMIQRFTHYPPRDVYDDNEFSIAPHTDSGFMTLLAPSEVPGLQIRLPNGTWIDAPSDPDAFVVNGGDILKRWTNDRFLSTPHRAINSSGRARYAIPFFFDPHPDTVIACLPTCQGPGNPPKYEPTTYDQYALWYAQRNYVHLNQEAA